MGLLKWLKREADASQRHDDEPPPAAGTDMSFNNGGGPGLARNESYLKALTKFNKWRQMHLSAAASAANKSVSQSLSSLSNKGDSFSSQLVYEEINFNEDELNRNLLTNANAKLALASSGLITVNRIGETSEKAASPSPTYGNAEGKDDDLHRYVEPEYALPFSNTSNASNEWRDHLLVTDLDKSLDSNKVNDMMDEKLVANKDLQFVSELMVLPLARINVLREKLSFNTVNSHIQHGAINSIEISYLQMKDNHNEAICYNFEALRKLRHPNIVLLMGICLDKHSNLEALIIEPSKCSLYERIHFDKDRIPLDRCHHYALQLADAVIFLHEHSLIHSNICSHNVIVPAIAEEVVKLGGFELQTNVNTIAENFALSLSNNITVYGCLPLSTDYRKKHAKHFYQAPELLSDTQPYVQPTNQSDIYGLCITLWEMLNCVIPYLQFTPSELIKVFQLKNAQLPIYEKKRHHAFKNLLDKGLQIQIEQRISSAIALKAALKTLQPIIAGTEKLQNTICQVASFNEHNPKIDLSAGNAPETPSYLPCERTSTIKRHNDALKSANRKLCTVNASSWKQHFEEPCSPIATNTPPQKTWHLEENAENVAQGKTKASHEIEQTHTPNKRYSVNILIRSKCSPNTLSPKNACCDTAGAVKTSNVQKKINKFESFLMPSPDKRCGYSQNPELMCASSPLTQQQNATWNCNSKLNEEVEEPIAKKPYNLLQGSEDFYIDDDDFPNDCNLGVNFELNFNYLQRNA